MVRHDSMSFRDDLTRLCSQAKVADDHGSDSTTDFEPQVLAVLSRCEQELREGNEQEVISGLVAIGRGEIPAPYETLMFCLHKLRLCQVLEEIETYQKSLDPASRRSHDFKFGYLPHIRESLSANWSWADIFAEYRKPK
jgi:hypothetical protein